MARYDIPPAMSKVKMADANASCTFRIISAIFFPSVSEAIQVRRPEPRTRIGFWGDFKSMPNLSVIRRGFARGCRIQHDGRPSGRRCLPKYERTSEDYYA